MDETLRVKIVADTVSATSSLKQLNKETQGFGSGTSAATQAVNQLDKALNSIGFRAIRINSIRSSFSGIKAEAQKAAAKMSASFQKINSSLGRLKELHNYKFFNPFMISAEYLDKMSKKSSDAVDKIKALQRAISTVGMAGAKGDFSGLAGIRLQVEDLAHSSDRVIRRTFNERDFTQMKESLLAASTAAAKGSATAFENAMSHMATTVGKATEKLTINGLLKGLRGKVKGVFDYIIRAIGVIGKLLKGLFTGGIIIGLLGAVAAIKNAFSVSKLGDQIDKTSQKVGMTTTAFQKWSYILERCGLEASQLQTSMRALTRSSMGSNSQYFQQLGIDPTKLSQQQLFEKTVEALQNITNTTERARMAYRLFGQSSAELAPLLNTSAAEVQRLTYQYDLLGATMSGRTVRASADMRDAITDLKAAFQGLKNTLAQAIIPLITQIIVRLTVFVAKINMILKSVFGIELEFADVAVSTYEMSENVDNTVSAVKKLKTLISGFDELNIFPSQDSGTGSGIGGGLDYSDLYDYPITTTNNEIGSILPDSAIKELEEFRDVTLPSLIEKIDSLKETWNRCRDAFNLRIEPETNLEKFLYNTGTLVESFWDNLNLPDIDWDSYSFTQFFEDIKNELNSPVFEESAWSSFLNDLINLDFNNLFGKVDLNDFFSPESMFGDLADGWQFEDTALGKWAAEQGTKFRETFIKNGWVDPEKLIDPNSPAAEEEAKKAAEVIIKTTNPITGGLNIFKGLWAGYEELMRQIDEFKDNADIEKEINSWKNFGIIIRDLPKYFQKLYQTNPKVRDLVDTCKELYNTIAQSDFGQGLKELVEDIENSDFVQGLNDLKEEFNEELNQFFEPFISPFKKWLGLAEDDVKEGTANVVEAMEEGLAPAKKSGEEFYNGIMNFWQEHDEGTGFFDYGTWKEQAENIPKAIEDSDVKGKTTNYWNEIVYEWGKVFDGADWHEKGKDAAEGIAEGMNAANIDVDLSDKLDEAANKISMAEIFSKSFWMNKFGVIPEGLKDVDMGDNPKKAAEKMAKKIQEALNGIIYTFNNSSAFQAVSKFIGIQSLPYINLFAKGGVVTEATLGIMGEYPGAKSNPEIITPENKMREVFENSNSDIVNVLVQGFRQIVQAIDEKDTTVQIGDSAIAKSAARGNNEYRLQTGQSLF